MPACVVRGSTIERTNILKIVYLPLQDYLIFACLVSFHVFWSSADFLKKLTFSKRSFSNTIGMSNSLDPNQARRIVGPDLVPKCLQRLSADDTNTQMVNDRLDL